MQSCLYRKPLYFSSLLSPAVPDMRWLLRLVGRMLCEHLNTTSSEQLSFRAPFMVYGYHLLHETNAFDQ
jgi:hypothetical protein